MTRESRFALGFDLLAVLIFVAIGRRNHDEGGNAVLEALRVAAPFLIAAVGTWSVFRLWNDPFSQRSAIIVSVGTILVGMVLRKFVFDRGTATAFVIVATVTLGLLFNGWRAAWRHRHHS